MIEKHQITVYSVKVAATLEEWEQIDDTLLGLADWENECDWDNGFITYDHFEDVCEARNLESGIIAQLEDIKTAS